MNRTSDEVIYNKETVSIRLSGTQMNKAEGYDLNSIIKTLGAVESMAKKTFLFSKGSNKVIDDEFSVKLMGIQEGSFISNLQFVYSDLALPLAPLVPLVIENKDVIWNAIKTSYDFLNAKLIAEKEGQIVKVNQSTDQNGSNINIENNNGTITINVNPGISDLAEKCIPQFSEMTKQIDGVGVEEIELFSIDGNSDNAVTLRKSDRDIFRESTFTEDDEFVLTGKILSGDFTRLKGKIEVIAVGDNELTVGATYNFSTNKNIASEDVWRQMFLQEQTYRCKRRVKYSPSASSPSVDVYEIIIVEREMQKWVA